MYQPVVDTVVSRHRHQIDDYFLTKFAHLMLELKSNKRVMNLSWASHRHADTLSFTPSSTLFLILYTTFCSRYNYAFTNRYQAQSTPHSLRGYPQGRA
jgi:hypothetical protein